MTLPHNSGFIDFFFPGSWRSLEDRITWFSLEKRKIISVVMNTRKGPGSIDVVSRLHDLRCSWVIILQLSDHISGSVENLEERHRLPLHVQSVVMEKKLIRTPHSSLHMSSLSSPPVCPLFSSMFCCSLRRSLNFHWPALVAPHYWPYTHSHTDTRSFQSVNLHQSLMWCGRTWTSITV